MRQVFVDLFLFIRSEITLETAIIMIIFITFSIVIWWKVTGDMNKAIRESKSWFFVERLSPENAGNVYSLTQYMSFKGKRDNSYKFVFRQGSKIIASDNLNGENKLHSYLQESYNKLLFDNSFENFDEEWRKLERVVYSEEEVG